MSPTISTITVQYISDGMSAEECLILDEDVREVAELAVELLRKGMTIKEVCSRMMARSEINTTITGSFPRPNYHYYVDEHGTPARDPYIADSFYEETNGKNRRPYT